MYHLYAKQSIVQMKSECPHCSGFLDVSIIVQLWLSQKLYRMSNVYL